MPRSPSAPGLTVRLVAGSEEQFQGDDAADDLARAERRLDTRRTPATSAPARASTCMPSAPAIMSGCAASRCRTSHGLVGHSDADVGLHALTDAILGALGAGDIGMHFPPSDPQWRGAPSHLFLRHAADLVAQPTAASSMSM